MVVAAMCLKRKKWLAKTFGDYKSIGIRGGNDFSRDSKVGGSG
jgi:hypothetical protein